MASFEPLTRSSLADGVFDQIVDQIVAGDLPGGDPLPSERHLAEAFGVSRPAVREALKRLAQTGMVAIRQGESTIVRAWRRTAGPDLLARLLVGSDGSVDLVVARSILEVRQQVGPDIAALAAQRGDRDLAAQLDGHLNDLESTTDPVALQHAALAYWDRLVDASHNVAYRLMTNTLTAAYLPLLEPLAHVMHAEVSNLPAYRQLRDMVIAQDAAGARQAAEDLLAAGTGAVLQAIEAAVASQSQMTDEVTP